MRLGRSKPGRSWQDRKSTGLLNPPGYRVTDCMLKYPRRHGDTNYTCRVESGGIDSTTNSVPSWLARSYLGERTIYRKPGEPIRLERSPGIVYQSIIPIFLASKQLRRPRLRSALRLRQEW